MGRLEAGVWQDLLPVAEVTAGMPAQRGAPLMCSLFLQGAGQGSRTCLWKGPGSRGTQAFTSL